MADRRDDYVLISKCGHAFDDLPGETWSPTVIAHTIDRSLRRLRTDHLDVMLLHSCELGVLVKRPIANAAWKDLSEQRRGRNRGQAARGRQDSPAPSE